MLAIVWLARRWSLSAVANAEPTSEGKVSCLFALSTTMPRLFVLSLSPAIGHTVFSRDNLFLLEGVDAETQMTSSRALVLLIDRVL
jgi:hypothetical protein